MKRNLLLFILLCSAASLMAVPALRDIKGDNTSIRGCKHRGVINEQIARREATGKNRHSLERQLPPKVLVILTEFSNKQFRTENGKAVWEQFFAGEGVSVKQYFADQSFGQYVPDFDVVGPVRLDKSYEYYGKNIDGEDQAAEEMIVDACKKADEAGADFKQYDADGDGYVDCVYVLYAGKGEADSKDENSVWPHNYRIEDMDYECVVDGKRVNVYVCSNEINAGQKREGIGTACHEFSHVLGLPDMYPTNGDDDYKTLGAWDLMDYGAYNNNTLTPPSYSAYERWFMGWTEPYLMNEPMNFVLQDINKKGDCGIITEDGQSNLNALMPDPTEFYLIENRQQTKGSWDEYLPGHGMLLTKVKFVYNRWLYNEVNNLPKNMSIDIIEADGYAPKYSWYWEGSVQMESDNGYRGKKGDAFPTGATYYTPYKDYPITDITETDGIIRFTFISQVSKCTVSFYSNSTYGTCTTSTLAESGKGSGITLPSVNNKSGYTFLGWATKKNSTTADAGAAGEKYYPMSDCTLFAVYRDDNNWRIDAGGASGANGLLKGVVWEDGKVETGKYVTDKVPRGKDFYIEFSAKEGYLIPSAKTCQVRVTSAGKLLYVHSFANDKLRLDFKGADIDGDIVIVIVNTREQKEDGCEDYFYAFTSAVNIGTQDFGSYEWTVSMRNSEASTDYLKAKGAAFGSSSKPAQEVHLKTEEAIGCAISAIKVNASVASQGDGVLNVYVGGNIIGQTEQLTENSTEYVFKTEEPVSGLIDIRLVNSQKAVYIKSIDVQFTEFNEPQIDTQTSAIPSANWQVSADDGTIYVNNILEPVQFTLYNALGQTILEQEITSNISFFVGNGLYVVKLQKENNIITKKLLIY